MCEAYRDLSSVCPVLTALLLTLGRAGKFESIHFSMQEEQNVWPHGVMLACGLSGGRKQMGQTVSARTAATDTSPVMLDECVMWDLLVERLLTLDGLLGASRMNMSESERMIGVPKAKGACKSSSPNSPRAMGGRDWLLVLWLAAPRVSSWPPWPWLPRRSAGSIDLDGDEAGGIDGGGVVAMGQLGSPYLPSVLKVIFTSSTCIFLFRKKKVLKSHSPPFCTSPNIIRKV